MSWILLYQLFHMTLLQIGLFLLRKVFDPLVICIPFITFLVIIGYLHHILFVFPLSSTTIPNIVHEALVRLE